MASAGGTRPGATLREGQHDLDEDATQAASSRKPSVHKTSAARPLQIRGEQREGGEGEQDRGSPPAPPLQRDERSRDEGPGQREIRGHARPGGAGVDSEPADAEARNHDCRREQHRVAERAPVREGVARVDDITRQGRRTPPLKASPSR